LNKTEGWIEGDTFTNEEFTAMEEALRENRELLEKLAKI